MPDKHATQLARHATFRQLQVFECVVRHDGFGKAAEELHLTQPTVSMQMKKLSNALGVELFEKIGRKSYLTEAGQALYEGAENILSNLRVIEEQIDHMKGMKGGSLKIAVISTAQYFMPSVIKEFDGLYPDVNIAMRVGNKEQLIQRINMNRDDFYILGQPPEGLKVKSARLVSNPLFITARADCELVGCKLSLEELNAETFLMREKGSGIRSHIERVFADLDFEPKRKMVLGSNEAIRLGMLEGMGVAVLSLPTMQQELEQGDLMVLDVEHFPIHRNWYLAYPIGKILSPVARAFIQLLKIKSQYLDEFAQKAGIRYTTQK